MGDQGEKRKIETSSDKAAKKAKFFSTVSVSAPSTMHAVHLPYLQYCNISAIVQVARFEIGSCPVYKAAVPIEKQSFNHTETTAALRRNSSWALLSETHIRDRLCPCRIRELLFRLAAEAFLFLVYPTNPSLQAKRHSVFFSRYGTLPLLMTSLAKEVWVKYTF